MFVGAGAEPTGTIAFLVTSEKRELTHDECLTPDIEDRYLGCGMSSRYQEPLEDWTRGRDLPDGKCDLETWNRILCAIVGTELINCQLPTN